MITTKFIKSKNENEITFTCDSICDECFLITNVNDWEPIPMKFTKTKNSYNVKLRTTLGKILYKFILVKNGIRTFIVDNTTTELENDGFNGVNSVYRLN